jgi:hypothetical protein
MPVRHRRSTFAVRNSGRRKLVWGTLSVPSTALASLAGITPKSILANITTNGIGITGGTVMRTHVVLSLSCTDADTSPGAYWGLAVLDNTMVGVDVPAPSSSFGTDWMMNTFLTPGTADNSIGSPINAPTGVLYGKTYDIRSRRRLHEMNDDYWFCLFNAGSASMNYSVFIKALVALP